MSKRQYELVYTGKIKEEDILANKDGVFPVSLEIEKVFNSDRHEIFEDNWKNMIVYGDNLQFLKTVYENKDPLIKDKVKGKVKLIYIDPPFATKNNFKNKDGQRVYTDKLKGAEFIEFLRRRLILAREILADNGIIIVHLDWRKQHYLKIILDEIFKEKNFRNEIIWHYFMGGKAKKFFSRKHDNLLCYSKSDTFTFNELVTERILPYTPSMNNKGLSQIACKNCGKGSGIWKSIVKQDDVWDISGVFNMSHEYLNYPTQKPEGLLKRIIDSFSNENDLILDFFGGSGTTMAVAEKLNRKWIVCDFEKLSYFVMQKRILQIQNSKDLKDFKKKYGKKAKSFITVSFKIHN